MEGEQVPVVCEATEQGFLEHRRVQETNKTGPEGQDIVDEE